MISEGGKSKITHFLPIVGHTFAAPCPHARKSAARMFYVSAFVSALHCEVGVGDSAHAARSERVTTPPVSHTLTRACTTTSTP